MNRIRKAKSLMLVSESGVGKVNAALASQMLIDYSGSMQLYFPGWRGQLSSDYADSSAPTDFSSAVKMALRAQVLVMAMLKELAWKNANE